MDEKEKVKCMEDIKRAKKKLEKTEERSASRMEPLGFDRYYNQLFIFSAPAEEANRRLFALKPSGSLYVFSDRSNLEKYMKELNENGVREKELKKSFERNKDLLFQAFEDPIKRIRVDNAENSLLHFLVEKKEEVSKPLPLPPPVDVFFNNKRRQTLAMKELPSPHVHLLLSLKEWFSPEAKVIHSF